MICYSYKTIWKIIRRHQRQIQTEQPINQEQNAFDLLKYKAKTFTSLMVLKLFVLCYLPYLCVELKKLTRRGHKSIDVVSFGYFQILISLIIWFAVGRYSILAILSVAGALCCTLVICYSYKTIWKIIRRHQRQIQTEQPINQEQNAFDLLKYKAKTFTSLMVLKLFVLCYLPYLCVELKKLTRRGHKSIDVVEHSVLVTIVFANSSLNPLIYFWRIKDLRRAALSTLRSLIIC